MPLNESEVSSPFETDPGFNVTAQLRELSLSDNETMASDVTLDSHETASNTTLHDDETASNATLDGYATASNATLHGHASNVTLLADEHLFVGSDDGSDENEAVTTRTTHQGTSENVTFEEQDNVQENNDSGHQLQTTTSEVIVHHADQNMTFPELDGEAEDLNPELTDAALSSTFENVTPTFENVTAHSNVSAAEMTLQTLPPTDLTSESQLAEGGILQKLPTEDVTGESLPAPESLNEDEWFKTHHSRALHRYYKLHYSWYYLT